MSGFVPFSPGTGHSAFHLSRSTSGATTSVGFGARPRKAGRPGWAHSRSSVCSLCTATSPPIAVIPMGSIEEEAAALGRRRGRSKLIGGFGFGFVGDHGGFDEVGLGADALFDGGGDVGGRVLAPLADAVAGAGERGAGFFGDAGLPWRSGGSPTLEVASPYNAECDLAEWGGRSGFRAAAAGRAGGRWRTGAGRRYRSRSGAGCRSAGYAPTGAGRRRRGRGGACRAGCRRS